MTGTAKARVSTAKGKAKVAAVPAGPVEAPHRPVAEPAWLVRIVLLLFLVGFAAFLAREVRNLAGGLGTTATGLYWTGLAVGIAAGALLGALLGWLAGRRGRRA